MKIARKIRTRLYSSRNAKNRRRSESELGRGTTFPSLAARRTWKLSDIANSEFSEKRAGHWAGLRTFASRRKALKPDRLLVFINSFMLFFHRAMPSSGCDA